MTDLATKLDIELNPPAYVGRACGTCRHYRDSGRAFFNECLFWSRDAGLTRVYNDLCGPEGKNWEPHPPRPPSIGLFGHIRKLLWGSK